MGFRQGNFAKVWGTTVYENYTVVELSTSKKNKKTGEYETDFSSKFVKFIGQAHRDATSLTRGTKIKIGECDVTSRYDKEKKQAYTDFLVFTFEIESTNPNEGTTYGNGNTFMTIPDDVVGELPFS